MGQGGSCVTLMEAWWVSLHIPSTKLCCSCFCKNQLPLLISPFPRAHSCRPAAGLWCVLTHTLCAAPPDQAGWEPVRRRPHLSISHGSLQPWQELGSACFQWRSAHQYTHDWTSPFSFYRLPWLLRRWRICPQCGRTGFDPWVEKNPWSKAMASPVFLPGEFHGQRSLAAHTVHGVTESDTAEWLTLSVSGIWKPQHTSSSFRLCVQEKNRIKQVKF